MESPRRAPGGLPIGTGPFRVVSSAPGRVELERHAGYWGGPPRLEKLVFRRFAGEDALVEALFAGEVDVTNAIGQDRVGRLRRHPEVTLDSRTGLNLAFLSVNNERRPFSDVRVRRALARAIDRDLIVRDLLGGHGEPAKNPLPPLLAGYDPRAKALPLDRAGARRLLAEAGFPAGFETSLLAVASPRAYLPSPLRMAARIQADLARVGVKAALREASSWTEYIGRASRGEYDLCLLGWQADTPDPNDFLSALLATEALGVTNRSRYRSPAMDALLKRARLGRDMAERLRAYHEAQRLFRTDMPFVPLYHGSVFTAYRKAVRGLLAGPTGVARYDKAWKLE
jgi:ABC-type transport system substrate-binding protein